MTTERTRLNGTDEIPDASDPCALEANEVGLAPFPHEIGSTPALGPGREGHFVHAAMTPLPIVYVVSPDPELRSAIQTLAEAARLHVQTFASTAVFMRSCPRDATGCVILDVSHEGTDAASAEQTLAGGEFRMPVVLVTVSAHITLAAAALTADARGGHAHRHRVVAAVLGRAATELSAWPHARGRRDTEACYAQLTRREREVLELVIQGERSRSIASKLGIGEKTVEIYRSSINRKMGTHNAAELAQVMVDYQRPGRPHDRSSESSHTTRH